MAVGIEDGQDVGTGGGDDFELVFAVGGLAFSQTFPLPAARLLNNSQTDYMFGDLNESVLGNFNDFMPGNFHE